MKKNKPGNKQTEPLKPFFFTEAPLFEVGAEEGASLQELLSNKVERYQVVTICPIWCPPCALFSSNVIKTWAGEIANVGFTEIIVQDRNRNPANEEDAETWDNTFGLTDKGVTIAHINGDEKAYIEVASSIIAPLQYYGRNGGSSFSFPTSFVYDKYNNQVVSALVGYDSGWEEGFDFIINTTINFYEANQNGDLLSLIYRPSVTEADGSITFEPLAWPGANANLDFAKTSLFFGPTFDLGNGADNLNPLYSLEPKKLDLGNGDDLAFGSFGKDEIIGGNGVDTILGLFGADFIDAGRGDDIIFTSFHGAPGTAYYTGGKGSDAFYIPLIDTHLDGKQWGIVNDFEVENDTIFIINKYNDSTIPVDQVSGVTSSSDLLTMGIAGQAGDNAFIGDILFLNAQIDQVLASTTILPYAPGPF